MSEQPQKILVVDDELQIRRLVRIGLEARGYRVIEATSVREGIARCAEAQPDLVILDLGLPDLDGRDLISEVRVWSKIPILVLSVRSSEEEKVAALDLGASDYVSKPFSMAELLARVRALLRDRPRDTDEDSVFRVGELELDVPRHRVQVGNRPLKLSPKEFALLRMLVSHAGRVVTHKQLLNEVWGRVHESDTQYLRVYVGQLREKLGDDPARPRFIENLPGIGYRFIEPE
jgi:two-component system, OmpR family, KDP operon response regulator KdpE